MKILYSREKGVASVVGTLFALLLFVTLLSVFVTQYVPVYMKTNEAQHDIQVLSQFSQLRTEIDMLTITGNLNYTTYAPITMGAAGIPLFAQPTIGALSVYPYAQNYSKQYLNLSFTQAGVLYYLDSGGSIEFIAPNKYYVPESFIYFDGALIRHNLIQNASVVVVGGEFTATKQSTGATSLYIMIQKIYGPSTTVTGTETRGLELTLIGEQKNIYTLSNVDVTITLNTTFNTALIQWFETQALNANILFSTGSNNIVFHDVSSLTVLNVYIYVTTSQ